MTEIEKHITQCHGTKLVSHLGIKGYFSPSGKGHSYSIMLPPPNVTGNLHMGHGLVFTLIDVLIRYHRMCGNTLATEQTMPVSPHKWC